MSKAGSLDRRTFLEAGAALGVAALLPPSPGEGAFTAIPEATVADLQAAMASGALSAKALTASYLARIRELDGRLGAVIEVNPEALAAAEALDLERARKGPRGPLHGLPVLVKDNLDTADRMRTTAGSLALAEAPTPMRDAHLVARLREAGAVLLGKANLSEWANFRSTRASSGWSARGGQTRNPYALDRNPSGSSSGSAAAVSANLCALAVGTETDGSIVCPAAMCGVVGLKPTLGLCSRAGIIPIAHSQDTGGPMTRTVADAAALLTVLAGSDPRDPATEAADRRKQDYTRALAGASLGGVRLGVLQGLRGQHEGVDRVMDRAFALLRGQGATLVEVDLSSSAYEAAELEVLLFEFKADLEAYLAGRGGKVRTLKDLIAFNEAHRREEMPHFGQEILLQAAAKGGLQESAYRKALEACAAARRDLEGLLAARQLAALIGPTTHPAHLTDWINGDYTLFGCTTVAAVGGTPHLTVPAGFDRGLPVGLSFLGGAWSEARLLAFGHAFEQATRARRVPTLAPSLS